MWKKEYAKTRREKYANCEKEREKRKSQGRSKEDNKVYMSEYYKNNKDKFKLCEVGKYEKNKKRRDRYAQDKEYREYIKEYNKSRYCPNERYIKAVESYGITISEYKKMLKKQDGKCYICKSSNADDNKTTRLYIDHCHEKGHIRGLLCSKCNFGLGNFNDSIEELNRAIDYLKNNGK